MKFTEAKLEQAIIELLQAEGYPHILGWSIARANAGISETDFEKIVGL